MTNVFIVSAPSGLGEVDPRQLLMERDPKLLFSVLIPLAHPAGRKLPGESYHYISREAFEDRIA